MRAKWVALVALVAGPCVLWTCAPMRRPAERENLSDRVEELRWGLLPGAPELETNSWSLAAQAFPPGVDSVDDLPADFEPAPLGSRAELTRRIQRAVPETEFLRPSLAVARGDGWVLRFSFVGGEDPVRTIAIQASGDRKAEVVSLLLERLKLRARMDGAIVGPTMKGASG